MLKVGDRVKVLAPAYPNFMPVGSEATIVSVDTGLLYPYGANAPNNDALWVFMEHELELIESAAQVSLQQEDVGLRFNAGMYQDNNPKTAIGALKLPLHLVPPSAAHYLAKAFADGAKKYDPYNWRRAPVSVSTYYGAARRHEDAFWDGEELAQDSLVEHLAHAMACYAILLDAAECGTLIDDRPTKGTASQMQMRWLNLPSVDEE